jgi:hypothetical protein
VDYEDLRRLPWLVLESGFRQPDRRGNPRLDPPVSEILEHLPAQVELGCGPSIEAGIPPLRQLHDVYHVADRSTRAFLFGSGRDVLPALLVSEPERTYRRFVEMFRRCFTASPTRFHSMLRTMQRRGLVVGPVLTNNFDGLPRRLGLSEVRLRRYDEIEAPVSFHPAARSLLVVGSHADRRRLQRRARERGLKVIHVNPEGYVEHGSFVPDPVEGPQSDDLFWREGATPAFARFVAELGSEPSWPRSGAAPGLLQSAAAD